MTMVGHVSTIITAYNAQPWIARSVRSALALPQVHEVLLVDDASQDGTAQAAIAAAGYSERLRVIRLERNAGPARARNIAMKAATGRFIAVLDADDYFLADRFSAMADDGWDFLADNIAFIPEGAAAPAFSSQSCDSRSRDLTLLEFVERNISLRRKPRGELGFLKPVMRFETLRRLGLVYDEALRLGEDFILYATALARGATFRLTQSCGYVAEQRRGSLSGNHSTADLSALAEAGTSLIAEMAQGGCGKAELQAMKRHREGLLRKIATRQFLDEKQAQGVLRSAMKLAVRPDRFINTAAELAESRMRGGLPAQATGVRLLLDPSEFQQGDPPCS